MISPTVIAAAERHRAAFQTAAPFKHVCIDDFFTAEAAAASLRDFPPFDREFARNEFGEYGGKAVVSNIAEISPFYARLYDYAMSRPFLDALSAITGIEDLHGDPRLYGGGTHNNINGQELDVHVDFNFQIEGGYHRRANLLLYLNREWDAAWGGAIELHSDPRRPEIDEFKQFNVIFNRAVIFETNEHSWHGFRRIRLPPDRLDLTRKCLSLYLYAAERPADEIAGSHGTFYVQWPFPEKFAAGHMLSSDDVEELQTGYARRDRQIEMYRQLTRRLGRELAQLPPHAGSPAAEAAAVPCDLTIDFGAAGNSRHYCGEGWAAPEERHTWALGTASRLDLPPPRVAGTYAMTLEVGPHRGASLPGQRLFIEVNGREVGHFLLRERCALECVVPWPVLAARDPVAVVFRHPDAVTPAEAARSGDRRELAIVVERLQLFRLPEPAETCPHGFREIESAADPAGGSRLSRSIFVYPGRCQSGPSAYFVQWPLPERFAAGQILAKTDVQELREAYRSRDRQIELYQRLEERLGRELDPRRRAPRQLLPPFADDARGGGLVIDFGSAGNSREFCRDGWSDPEDTHTWTLGRRSSLELPLPAAAEDYVMALEIGPHRWPGMPGQRLTVVVNGSEVDDFLTQEIAEFECAIPWSILAAGEPISVVFRHPDAARPSTVSNSTDERELAIRFQRLRLFRRPEAPDILGPDPMPEPGGGG